MIIFADFLINTYIRGLNMKEELSKELLTELYINQGWSMKQIQEKLGISKGKFHRLCEKFNITIKNNLNHLNPNLVEQYYLKENHTIEQTSEYFNCSISSLRRLIDQYKLYKPNYKKQELIRETNKKRYGVEHHLANPIINNKRQKTNLERYGNVEAVGSDIIQAKIKNTNKRKYGVQYPLQNKEIQNKVSLSFLTGIPQQKCYNTKKQNNTFNTSQPEEKAYALLVEHFSENDVLRQYKSPSYPYPCDFYIKSLDLYIEYQGTWCHGNEPYNPNNRVHQEIVNKWSSKHTEYSDYAVKIWTERDPEKRKIAKENNLNWKEFFSMDELSNWLNSL